MQQHKKWNVVKVKSPTLNPFQRKRILINERSETKLLSPWGNVRRAMGLKCNNIKNGI
jgi:hypothetical protein